MKHHLQVVPAVDVQLTKVWRLSTPQAHSGQTQLSPRLLLCFCQVDPADKVFPFNRELASIWDGSRTDYGVLPLPSLAGTLQQHRGRERALASHPRACSATSCKTSPCDRKAPTHGLRSTIASHTERQMMAAYRMVSYIVRILSSSKQDKANHKAGLSGAAAVSASRSSYAAADDDSLHQRYVMSAEAEDNLSDIRKPALIVHIRAQHWSHAHCLVSAP